MLSNKEKVERLQECIALLQDVDAMQQTALGDIAVAWDNHVTIQSLIEDFEEDIEDLKSPLS